MTRINLITRIFSIFCLFSSATLTHATELDFALGDDSVYGVITPTNSRSNAHFSFGYLYHEKGRNVYHIDLHAQGQTVLGNLPTTAGIGFKFMGYKEHSAESYGAGIGGFGEINIPDVPGLSAMGSLHYAPSILTTGDSKSMTWLDLGASYRMIRNADIQGGYRYVNTRIEGASGHTIESGLFIGFRLHF